LSSDAEIETLNGKGLKHDTSGVFDNFEEADFLAKFIRASKLSGEGGLQHIEQSQASHHRSIMIDREGREMQQG
jgi:hypothetical protein